MIWCVYLILCLSLSCHDNAEIIFPGHETPLYTEYSASCLCGDYYYQFYKADCNNETRCAGESSGFTLIDSISGICDRYESKFLDCFYTFM